MKTYVVTFTHPQLGEQNMLVLTSGKRSARKHIITKFGKECKIKEINTLDVYQKKKGVKVK